MATRTTCGILFAVLRLFIITDVVLANHYRQTQVREKLDTVTRNQNGRMKIGVGASISNKAWKRGINDKDVVRVRSSLSLMSGLHIQDTKRQMIAPGYYEAECSDKKPCKAGKYCNLLYCEDCHKHKMACAHKKQCCNSMVCTYGRCEKKTTGDPGTFCEKDTDCTQDSCCVLEPTVNTVLPICKPTLDEYHQCASILYRKIWVGEKPDCGPCKTGLQCTQKGILASHEICMKPQK